MKNQRVVSLPIITCLFSRPKPAVNFRSRIPVTEPIKHTPQVYVHAVIPRSFFLSFPEGVLAEFRQTYHCIHQAHLNHVVVVLQLRMNIK